MKDIGLFKTAAAKSFRCHFDEENKVAFARGPLPRLDEEQKIEAGSEEEAKKKLSEALGEGVFAPPEEMP